MTPECYGHCAFAGSIPYTWQRHNEPVPACARSSPTTPGYVLLQQISGSLGLTIEVIRAEYEYAVTHDCATDAIASRIARIADMHSVRIVCRMSAVSQYCDGFL
jgi:hypothetical protein